MVAQSNGHKTVIYKIHNEKKNQVLSQSTCNEIDKMFISKKGILSSKTNVATLETTVKMINEVPEADLKVIFISHKLEVEIINVVHGKN